MPAETITRAPSTPMRERVNSGALFLTILYPSWWDAIDLDSLTMWDPASCILGQLWGNYWDAKDMLRLSGQTAHNFGFYITAEGAVYDGDKYGDLHREWVSVIKALRTL